MESFEFFWILLESFGIFEQLGEPRTQEFLRVTQQFLQYLGRLRSREYLEPCFYLLTAVSSVSIIEFKLYNSVCGLGLYVYDFAKCKFTPAQ